MYKLNGYVFESKASAENAAKEMKNILYIKKHINMKDADSVLKLYTKLIDQQVFKTPDGIAYLHSLWEYLNSVPYIKSEDIPLVPIKTRFDAEDLEAVVGQETLEKKAKVQVKNADYKVRYKIACFSTIVFGLALCGIFAITYFSGSSTTIFNYEQKIQDKYSSWEQELDQREKELRERENLLNSRLSEQTE